MGIREMARGNKGNGKMGRLFSICALWVKEDDVLLDDSFSRGQSAIGRLFPSCLVDVVMDQWYPYEYSRSSTGSHPTYSCVDIILLKK
jgi:hypothetical protein